MDLTFLERRNIPFLQVIYAKLTVINKFKVELCVFITMAQWNTMKSVL